MEVFLPQEDFRFFRLLRVSSDVSHNAIFEFSDDFYVQILNFFFFVG